MKDVNEKLRETVAKEISAHYSPETMPQNYAAYNYAAWLEDSTSKVSKLFDAAIQPILAELDELAEIKRLMPLVGEGLSMDYRENGEGAIVNASGGDLKVFGPNGTLTGPLEALRSLLPPPEEVVSTATSTTIDVGVFNGMKFTLTATPEGE